MDEMRARYLLSVWIGLSVRTEKVLAGLAGVSAAELLADMDVARKRTWYLLEPPPEAAGLAEAAAELARRLTENER